jgi:hypothetical protein
MASNGSKGFFDLLGLMSAPWFRAPDKWLRTPERVKILASALPQAIC